MTVSATPTKAAARPIALFVLGMGRSGTSALTRVLSLCGGALPAKLVGANSSNPLGHWEPREAFWLNDAILYRHGSSRYDPSLRLQEEDQFDTKEKAAWVAVIGEFLTELPAAPLVVIKELAITALSDMWFDAALLAGFDIVTVIAVRHPQEVVDSRAVRDGASPELTSAMWLKYSLLAERRTRKLPRVFVEYINLLDDWRREMARVSKALAIELDTLDEDAVDEFLQKDLRRQRNTGPATELFGTDWISVVHETLGAAARDEPWNHSALDRVFEAYRTSERSFRTASDDFRNRYNPYYNGRSSPSRPKISS